MGTTRERTAVDQALLEQLAHLANQTTRQTELLTGLRGLALNDVLWAGTVTLDARGVGTVSNAVPFASFGVWHRGLAGDLVVVAGTEEGSPPNDGPGVFRDVGPGDALVWPATGSSLTIYGTAGDRVVVALWATLQPPMVAAAAKPA